MLWYLAPEGSRRYHDAQDAVSDALLAIYQEGLAGELREPPEDWSRWLYGRARSFFKRRRRLPRPGSRFLTREKRAALRQRAADLVEAVLDRYGPRLTPAERAVLVERSKGLSYSEIEAILGFSADSARTHLKTTKAKLHPFGPLKRIAL